MINMSVTEVRWGLIQKLIWIKEYLNTCHYKQQFLDRFLNRKSKIDIAKLIVNRMLSSTYQLMTDSKGIQKASFVA